MIVPDFTQTDSGTKITGLQSQFPSDIIGIPVCDPLITWQITSEHPDAVQLAYEISSIDERGNLSASAIVHSENQIENPAVGHITNGREIKRFQVRISTQYGWTQYSPLLTLETGLTSGHNLVGDAIGDLSKNSEPSPILRKVFSSEMRISKARLYVVSQGLHNLYLNSIPVSDEFMTPGWTAYDSRVLIHTYDVTTLISQGGNCIAAELGDGWTRGKLGFLGLYNNYSSELSLLAQLEITYMDGSTQQVITDNSWKISQGEIRFADIYDGTEIDFTKRQSGWMLPGFDDSHWESPTIHHISREILEPRISNKVVKVGEFPGRILDSSNRTLLDFSQNISGWVRLSIEGKKGDLVEIKHAEVLEDNLQLHMSALRTAKAMDTYILGEDGLNILEPRFTFHGFQYAEVKTQATFISAVGVAISSASERRGFFDSSSARLNRLHENVVWSIADNMVTLPTDCPQRDERLGWTGDAQAIAMASNTIFNLDSFWRSWLRDLWKDQQQHGQVGAVVPDLLSKQPAPAEETGMIMEDRAGWADAATIVPYSSYLNYGSVYTLKEQLQSIRQYVDSLDKRRNGEKFLPTEFQFGDWCDPDAPGDKPWLAKVSANFVSNSFFAHTAELAAKIEKIVGSAEFEEKFLKIASTLKADVWEHFGEEAIKSTAGCSIALEFDIAPENERAAIAEKLANIVMEEKGRISTGFLGTPLVLHALSKNGKLEAAFTMLMRRKVYSWLYQVDRNATTVWERWDAIKEDGSLHTGEMASYEEEDSSASMISYNHYAYGAVMDWVYQNVAGLSPIKDNPGYSRFEISPKIGTGFTYAGAELKTPYGLVSIRWNLTTDNVLVVKATVPFGSKAVVNLPVTNDSVVHMNGIETAQGSVVAHGDYTFVVTSPEIVTFEMIR